MVRGVPTQFGSRLMAGFVPETDDHVVSLLRAAGTISVGKTATPEFGLPCYTETDIGPPARTPWDTGRLAGGSSGGAAAAVAGGFVPIAQGSDGGGSIRIPASVCGLVGLKTSAGTGVARAARPGRDATVGARPARAHRPRRRRVPRRGRDRRSRAIPIRCRRCRPASLPRLVRPRPGPAADRPLHSTRRSTPNSTRRCARRGSGRASCSPASGTSSRTWRRRCPPDAVPAFETVWSVSAATHRDPAAPRARAACPDPAPARARTGGERPRVRERARRR